MTEDYDMNRRHTKKFILENIALWKNQFQSIAEALTIPADKAGPVELQLRAALKKRKDCKHEDVVVKCCRNEEKAGVDKKQLIQTYIVGLGNIIDLLKVYDQCKNEYITQKIDKKVELQRNDGKTVYLDPIKDFGKIGRLPVLKQFIDKLQNIVAGDDAIQSTFQKYAITDEDRKCIRLICWNDNVMVWGTKEFSPSQKFAVQLWQNIDTIDSGSAYGDPDEQCPYCTHSKNHWDNHADDDPDYEQYWYLKTIDGVPCTKKGDLNSPEVIRVYNAMKGLGPDLLVCQHDSHDDWCDRDDNPVSEYGVNIHDADQTVYLNGDGEAVGEDDIYDEEIDFVFGPDDEDWLDDVIELYDGNFQSVGGHAIKEWETIRDYQIRTGHVDDDSTRVLVRDDLEDEVNKKPRNDKVPDKWEGNATLLSHHFKDGAVSIALPKEVIGTLRIEGADITTLAGIPKATNVKFINCKLQSLSTSAFKDAYVVELTFDWCVLLQDMHLADAFEGASIHKVAINQTKNAMSFKSFMSSSGKKIKSIDELIITNSFVEEFDGMSQSVESQHIKNIDLHSVRVGSFAGILNEPDYVKIEKLVLDKRMGDEQFSSFPHATKSLSINFTPASFDAESSIRLFKTIWNGFNGNGRTFRFSYVEPDKDHEDASFKDTSSSNERAVNYLRAVCADSSPSRLDGLKFGPDQMSLGNVILQLSPRDRYEFQILKERCSCLSNESGVFDSASLHISERLPKMHMLHRRERSDYYNDNYVNKLWLLAYVEDGSLKLLDTHLRPVKIASAFNDWLVFDDMLRVDGQEGEDIDEFCNAVVSSYKTLFPNIYEIYIADNFRKNALHGIDDPKTSFYVSKDFFFSKCNVNAIYNSSKHAVSIEDCSLRYNGDYYDNAYFKKIARCTINSAKQTAGTSIHAHEIRDSKITAIKEVSVYSKTCIDSCTISSGDSCTISANDSIANTIVDAKYLHAYDCPKSASNCKFNVQQKVTIHQIISDETASAWLRCMIGKGMKIDMDDSVSNIKSLSILENLPSNTSADECSFNAHSLESMDFKLKNPGQVKMVSLRNYSYNKTVTVEGFDGSVALNLFVKPADITDKEKSSSELMKQFAKCFTVDSDVGPKAMLADPKYIGADGKVHVPSQLDECMQMPGDKMQKHILDLMRW